MVRPVARNDQLELARYYDAEGGEALGDRFIEQCDAGFKRLSKFPESGTGVRHKHLQLEGCRFILVPGFEKIVMFYRPMKDRIEIIRILHGGRDIADAVN